MLHERNSESAHDICQELPRRPVDTLSGGEQAIMGAVFVSLLVAFVVLGGILLINLKPLMRLVLGLFGA